MAREFRPEAPDCYATSAEILQHRKCLEQPDADTGHAAGQKPDPRQYHQYTHCALDACQMPLHPRQQATDHAGAGAERDKTVERPSTSISTDNITARDRGLFAGGDML